MRQKLLIANWKSYLSTSEALNLAGQVPYGENIIIAPSNGHLGLIAKLTPHTIASQDISALSSTFGAYTGETIAAELVDMGIKYAIIGHSERRASSLDNSGSIAKKAEHAIAAGITPIICIGETKIERETGEYREVIASQLLSLNLQTSSKIIVAYEPTWSVGTGIVPSSEEIAEIMNLIHSTLKIAGELILVYGGSVNAENAKNIVNIPGVDGLLIGKASSDPVQFKAILEVINSASSSRQ